jgi:cytochrome c-type biogenesis protein
MIDVDALRLGFAFSAGVATFFAPCAYPLLPGYVAFFLGDAADAAAMPTRLRRAVVVGGLASLGFFLVYAALAGVVAAVGTEVLGDIALLELVVGGLLIVLGGTMTAGLVTPSALHVRLPKRDRSKSGYLVFGIVYAVAAAGCTVPIFVAIAALALSAGPLGAVLVFGAYAGGMALLMILVTVLVATSRDSVLSRFTGNADLIARAAGVALVIAGIAQIYLFLFRFGGLHRLGLA